MLSGPRKDFMIPTPGWDPSATPTGDSLRRRIKDLKGVRDSEVGKVNELIAAIGGQIKESEERLEGIEAEEAREDMRPDFLLTYQRSMNPVSNLGSFIVGEDPDYHKIKILADKTGAEAAGYLARLSAEFEDDHRRSSFTPTPGRAAVRKLLSDMLREVKTRPDGKFVLTEVQRPGRGGVSGGDGERQTEGE